MDNHNSDTCIYGLFDFLREGMEMNSDFRKILFWIFAVTCVVLLLWLIFGDSPTELFVSSAVVVLIIMKIWGMNEKQIKMEMGTKNGFCNMGRDMKIIKQDMKLIKKRLGVEE